MVERPIDAIAGEVAEQPRVLDVFARMKLRRARDGCLFVGAGDSYAAALAGFYASVGRSVAVDPYVLASNPEFAEGLDVYFISASGRTTSNALAAKKVRAHARRTVTLTAVAGSRLADLADDVIVLPIPYRPRTPGMLSFSLSLLAVLKVTGVDGPCDFARAMGEAKKDSVVFSEGRGTTYLLGNALAYPVALYGAAKAYEVLGARAHAEILEEFSHLELFSLGKSDVVNSFACFDPDGLSGRLDSALRGRGFETRAVRSWGRSPLEQVFHAVFTVQLSVLQAARERGITSPRFLSAHGALAASDEMIY